jgi:hypothetical protein
MYLLCVETAIPSAVALRIFLFFYLTHELKMSHGINHASSHHVASEMSYDTPPIMSLVFFHFIPQIPLAIISHNA